MQKSGYQKLKDKYLQAKQDINTLVLKPESVEAERIRFNVKLKDSLANAALHGERNGTGMGILDYVKNDKNK